MTSIRSNAAALLLLAAACNHPVEERPRAAVVSAPTELVQTTDVAETRAVAGSVRAATIAPLAAKVMGNVIAVRVREGDRVRAGEVLVEIDDRGASAGAEMAQGALAGADAAIVAARANTALAKVNYERFSALRARGSVSPAELDEADARFKVAAAELDRATKARDAARAASRGAGVSLADTRVVAPIDGIVTARFVDPGAQAAPGMPLLTIESDGAARVETTVPEELVVHTGDAVTIESGGRRIDARVSHVVPALDEAARSALVKIDLPRDSGLRSGAFANVLFVTGRRSAITVPATAVQTRGSLTSVFIAGLDGAAHLRLVTTGATHDGRVEILSGLEGGERIFQVTQ